MKNILFIGNIPTAHPNSIGGASIYTKEILEEVIKNKDVDIHFTQIRKNWYKYGQVIDYFFFIFKFPFLLKNKDVISIHATWDFHITIGGIICLISKLFKKKVVYHFFGGNFSERYHTYPKIFKIWLDNTLFKSDYILMETQKMISYFKGFNKGNFVWFPNSRKKPKNFIIDKEYSFRFVFISRVTKTKGVDLLIEASNKLPKKYSINIFGPIDKQYYNEESFINHSIKYNGILTTDQVIKTLKDHDVVVLPSFHKGEGYPGILIEAMSVGKPIITTRLNALEEIVLDGYNGIIIQQHSIEELVEAITHFNEENYGKFVENSISKFEEFNIERIIEKLIKMYKS